MIGFVIWTKLNSNKNFWFLIFFYLMYDRFLIWRKLNPNKNIQCSKVEHAFVKCNFSFQESNIIKNLKVALKILN
jgi:hypothetical protein